MHLTNLAGVTLATFILVIALARHLVKARSLSKASWEVLASRLSPQNMSGIAKIALKYSNSEVSRVPYGESWRLLGGWRGLMELRRNRSILLALAAHAERWDLEYSVAALDSLRRDAARMERAILSFVVRGDFLRGNGGSGDSIYCIAHAYFSMTERVLDLLSETQPVKYPDLSDRIWNVAYS